MTDLDLSTDATIDVVVCIYNVEAYLGDCIESIARQTYANFRCILVNDESTDRSLEIAQAAADRDPRFLVVDQANRGPGPAGGRNGGIPYVRAPWMMFVDSDDILSPDALEVMLASAEKTGSEVVIGAVERMDSRSIWPSFLHEQVHQTERLATSPAEYPDMVWDSTAWNKLIRTDLWMREIGQFDEGRLYEDLWPMIRLFCLADGVDVLTEVVYFWRVREERNSVTQQLADPKGLIDKLDQMTKLDDFLQQTDQVVLRAQRAKLLEGDIRWLVEEVRYGSPLYKTAFMRLVRPFVQRFDEADTIESSVEARIMLELLRDGSIDQIGDYGALMKHKSTALVPVLDDGTDLHFDASVLHGRGLATHASYRATSADEAKLFASVDGATGNADGSFTVTGSVGFARLPHALTDDTRIELTFSERSHGSFSIDAELVNRTRVHFNRTGFDVHRRAGWSATLTPEDVARLHSMYNDDRPSISIKVTGPAWGSSTELCRNDHGVSAATPDGHVLHIRASQHERTPVEAGPGMVLEGARLDGDYLQLLATIRPEVLDMALLSVGPGVEFERTDEGLELWVSELGEGDYWLDGVGPGFLAAPTKRFEVTDNHGRQIRVQGMGGRVRVRITASQSAKIRRQLQDTFKHAMRMANRRTWI